MKDKCAKNEGTDFCMEDIEAESVVSGIEEAVVGVFLKINF